MKKCFLLLIFIAFCNLIFAQEITINDTIFQSYKIKKVPKIEIIDVTGKEHSGYLYHATDSTILISNEERNQIIPFRADDILKISYLYKPDFWKVTWTTFGIMQGINVLVGVTATSDYFPENLVIGQVIVLPVTAGVSLLAFTMQENYECIIDKDIENYTDFYPVIEKKLPKTNENYKNILANKKSGSFELTKQQKEIPDLLNPEKSSLLHCNVVINQSFNTIGEQLEDYAVSSNYSNIQSQHNQNTSFVFSLGINILPNFRISYLTFSNRHHSFYSNFSGSNNNFTNSELSTSVGIRERDLDVEYIINPVDRILKRKHEFAFSGGVSFLKTYTYNNFYPYPENNGYWEKENYYSDDDKLNIGFKVQGRYDYFLSRFFSVNAKFSYLYSSNIELSGNTYFFDDGTKVSISDETIEINAFNISFGLSLHFL